MGRKTRSPDQMGSMEGSGEVEGESRVWKESGGKRIAYSYSNN